MFLPTLQVSKVTRLADPSRRAAWAALRWGRKPRDLFTVDRLLPQWFDGQGSSEIRLRIKVFRLGFDPRDFRIGDRLFVDVQNDQVDVAGV